MSRPLPWIAALVWVGCGSEDTLLGGTDLGTGPLPTTQPSIPSTSSTQLAAGLAGELVGDGGTLGDQDLMLCNLVGCTVAESEPDGTFFVPLQTGWAGALKTHGEPDGEPRLATLLLPSRVDGDAAVQLGSVYVPELAEGVPFGSPTADPQTLDAGDGLVLTLDRGNLTAAPGTWLYDLAAGRVPDGHLRSYPELGDETVVAAFALHPFGATSSTPVAVRAPVDLPAGTEVWFRSISELDGEFSDPVPGTADGTQVATEPGTGLYRLTWVIITTSP